MRGKEQIPFAIEGSRYQPIRFHLSTMNENRIHRFNHWLAGHMEMGVTDRSLTIVIEEKHVDCEP